MRIKKIINAWRHKMRAAFQKQPEQTTLWNTKVQTVEGTIRPTVDYDDSWFCLLAQNANIIFDIGANVGYNAILANLVGKVDKYVLVDPNPIALKDAAYNLLLNNQIQNCAFYPSFVGEKNGEKIKFYTVGTGAAGSMFRSISHTASMINAFLWVETITLDYLVQYYDLQPDFVKIDVEGAEHFVFKGATKLATHKKTRFLVEMHATPEMSMVENADLILDWCGQNGYAAWYLKKESRITEGVALKERGKCHLLIQPEGWPYPDYLKGVPEKAPLSVVTVNPDSVAD